MESHLDNFQFHMPTLEGITGILGQQAEAFSIETRDGKLPHSEAEWIVCEYWIQRAILWLPTMRILLFIIIVLNGINMV